MSTIFPGMGISIPAMCWTVDHVSSDQRGVAMLHIYILTLHAVWFEKHILFLRIHFNLVVGYKWKIGVRPCPIIVDHFPKVIFHCKRTGLLPQFQLESMISLVCTLILGHTSLTSMRTFDDKQGDS